MATSDANYLFIDAGYLRRIIAEVLEPFVGQQLEINWAAIKAKCAALRVFYYDCLDEIQKDNEDQEKYEERLRAQREAFDYISEQDGYHVRLGSISGNGKRQRQKEVDVLIAVDMLMHSHNKNMKMAFLLSGDLDFKPVVDALIQLGTRVSIVCHKNHAAKKLTYSADSRIYLSLSDLWNLVITDKCPNAFPGFGRFDNEFMAINPIETGRYEGKEVNVYKNNDTYYVVMPNIRNMAHRTHWRYDNLIKLKECLSIEFGNITWNKS